jgi:hypothetical protein
MNTDKYFNFNLPEINTLSEVFWKAKPFPHVVIDNFLDKNDFETLSESVLKFSSNPDYEFKNSIEGGKAIYSNKNSPESVRKFVNTVSSDLFIEKLADLTEVKEIIPLIKLSEKHDAFRYFHEMKDGGILGTHVDHSMIEDNVHFLNSLFYITPEWSSKWGGNTEFYKYYGLIKGSEIKYKPNRLIIFLHSSKSFHKVSRIKNNKINRFSVYMDYYIHKNKLNAFVNSTKNNNRYIPQFWRHQTIFIPTFEQLIKSFFKKNKHYNKRYIYIFLKYIAKKFLQRIA